MGATPTWSSPQSGPAVTTGSTQYGFKFQIVAYAWSLSRPVVRLTAAATVSCAYKRCQSQILCRPWERSGQTSTCCTPWKLIAGGMGASGEHHTP